MMSLRFNIIDSTYNSPGYYVLKRYPELNKLPYYKKEEIISNFAKYIARLYTRLCKKSIKTQYYKSAWKPLDKGYRDYKLKHGLSGNIWEASSQLVNSITFYKSGDSYVVGIYPNRKYKNGVNMLIVAKSMEYGNEHMPARPLFTPVRNHIARNIGEYFDLFLKDPKHIKIINRRNRI